MKTVHVATVTWNVAEAAADSSDIETICSCVDLSIVDLLLITAQELVPLDFATVVGTTSPSAKWEKVWEEVLGDQWERVSGITLGAVGSTAYAKRSLAWRDPRSDSAACGLAGVFVNKGAAAIAMTIGNTSLLFVGAHLCASADKVDRRNADFRHIDAALFGKSFFGGDRKRLADTFDRVIFAGDLNYRLTLTERSIFDVLYDPKDPTKLLVQFDELQKQMALEYAFEGYVEAPVRFPPTYKYDKGTLNTFDTSKKQRVPSWTDRVLFSPDGIAPYAYNSIPALTRSDHKPVFAKCALLVE